MARKNLHASEHAEQVAFFRWLALQSNAHPEFLLAFAIPNGGYRRTITAAQLKAEGVKAGVPDVMLPVPRGEWHGLFIEMKSTAKSARVSAQQTLWIAALREQGYRVDVCRGWDEARDRALDYLLN